MIYMLDTDTVSLIIRKNPNIIKNLISHEDDEICISAISNAELCYGLEKRGSEKLSLSVRDLTGRFSIIAFDDYQGELYGRIRLDLEKSGSPLGDMDMLIAAAALSQNAILVTHNTRHFSRIKGLITEDWS